jgi:hypothetical protein
MKVIITIALALFASFANAVDYEHIDIDDVYYIYHYMTNEEVVVVRKLGEGKVKVRDLKTGDIQVVDYSALLTKKEIEAKDSNAFWGTAAVLGGAVYCSGNDNCKAK